MKIKNDCVIKSLLNRVFQRNRIFRECLCYKKKVFIAQVYMIEKFNYGYLSKEILVVIGSVMFWQYQFSVRDLEDFWKIVGIYFILEVVSKGQRLQ